VTKTLLVDGNNLLKVGFHGVKDYHHNGKHIGGIWHFLNTLRKFIENENFDKAVVFWDGENSSIERRLFYPQYKQNRNAPDEQIKNSFTEQKQRVKQYLEEMFVRQVDIDNNEADDMIAYYCQIATNENITIFSGDMDLTQLISERVCVYSPSAKRYYKNGDKIKLQFYELPHANVATYKIISGDKSDNIDGVYYLGEKTLYSLFPELFSEKMTVQQILDKANEKFNSDKNNSALKNLLSGKTKSGIFGSELFEVNEKLVDLQRPLITEDAKQVVESYYSETLDPDGRSHKTIIKMMMDDGIFKYLPKSDNAWVYFIKPFLKLTRKEKSNFRNSR
jgi:5'-3' exonuclease